jgi:hypothetical protein
MSKFIALTVKHLSDAGIPRPKSGKDDLIEFCKTEGIPVQDVIEYGRGRTPMVLKDDWDLFLARRAAPKEMGTKAERSNWASVIRRLERIEESNELILQAVSDLLERMKTVASNVQPEEKLPC